MKKVACLAVTMCGVFISVRTNAEFLVSSEARVSRYDDVTGDPKGCLKGQWNGAFTEEAEGVTIGPEHNVYAAGNDLGYGKVVRFNARTGNLIGDFVPLGSGGLTRPFCITFGPDTNLYVLSAALPPELGGGGGGVFRYNGASGTFRDVFVTNGSGGLTEPYDFEFRTNGYLYVSDMASGILRYNGKSGSFVDHFVTNGLGGLGMPTGIAFGPDGNLYVGNAANHNVLTYDGVSGAFLREFVPPGNGGLVWPNDLAFGPDGDLYVCNSGGVLKYNGTNGTFIGTNVMSFSRFIAFSPFLNLQVTGEPGGVSIMWPAFATNLTLEVSTNIVVAESWSAVSNAPTVNGKYLLYTNSGETASALYRLTGH